MYGLYLIDVFSLGMNSAAGSIWNDMSSAVSQVGNALATATADTTFKDPGHPKGHVPGEWTPGSANITPVRSQQQAGANLGNTASSHAGKKAVGKGGMR